MPEQTHRSPGPHTSIATRKWAKPVMFRVAGMKPLSCLRHSTFAYGGCEAVSPLDKAHENASVEPWKVRTDRPLSIRSSAAFANKIKNREKC